MTKEYLQKSKKIHKNNHCYAKVFSQDTFSLAFSYAKNEKFKKQYQDVYEYLIKIAVPLGHSRNFNKNGRIYTLNEGQCIITSSAIEKETGVKRSVFRKLIDGLKSEGILEVETNNLFTKITFLNFKERQKANSKVNFDAENYNYELHSLSKNNKKTIKSPPILKEIKNSSKEELVTKQINLICQEEKDFIDNYKSLHQDEELKDIDIKDHRITSKDFKTDEKPQIIKELKDMEASEKLKSKEIFNAFKKSKLFNFKGKYLTFSLFLKKLREWFIEFIAEKDKITKRQNLKDKIEAKEKTDLERYPETKKINRMFHSKLECFLGSEPFNAFFKNTLISKQENQAIDLVFPSERCYNAYFLGYKDKVDRVLSALGLDIKNINY